LRVINFSETCAYCKRPLFIRNIEIVPTDDPKIEAINAIGLKHKTRRLRALKINKLIYLCLDCFGEYDENSKSRS